MIESTDNPGPQIHGWATIQGTELFADKYPELHPAHFRLCQGLVFPSIGIGTYLGQANEATDANYSNAIALAVASGCNLIDTAINYRFQRSERSVRTALRQLMMNGFTREELIVCTKAGFIPFDGEYPKDPYVWIEDNLFKPGIISPDEIHSSGHCMAPMYLLHQLDSSRQNLGLDTIDIFYVHNPETQMTELNEVRFYEALEMAFRALESAVQEKKITRYGIATWDGFLESPESGKLMQLERVVEAARRAGGSGHHFNTVQMPFNLAMTDALTAPNQKLGDQTLTFLEAARVLNICVIGSASLLQGQLASGLSVTLQQAIPGMADDAARALQFARSAPDLTTALAGMQTAAHVTTNMELATVAPMDASDFKVLFGERE